MLQHRYTELLEKRITQLEAIVEGSSKNISNGATEQNANSTASDLGQIGKGTAANGTEEKVEATLKSKVMLTWFLTAAGPMGRCKTN